MPLNTILLKAAFALNLAIFCSALPRNLERRQRASVITRCTVPNTAALTFDDGPYNYIYNISSTLKANDAVGTFFFNGNNYGCIYSPENVERVKYVFEQGHQIASHTWSHPDLTSLSSDKIHDEFSRIDEALERITGAIPAFMRPPYGNYDDHILDIVGARHQSAVTWDFDSGDSTGVSTPKRKALYSKVANRHPSTILTLNHETHSSTAFDVLPYAIGKLRAKGYKLVSVAECVGRDPYQSTEEPATRTASWKC